MDGEMDNFGSKDSDDEEIVFLESTTELDEKVDDEDHQIPRPNVTIPTGSEEEKLVCSLVSDAVVESLHDLGTDDPPTAASSDSDITQERSKIVKAVPSTLSKRLYSTSSFSKDAASFLQEDSEGKQNATTDKLQTEKLAYEPYARATKQPQPKPTKDEARSPSRERKIARTKSGTVDFVARNKSMVASYGDRLTNQKKRRRPMTSIGRGRAVPCADGKDIKPENPKARVQSASKPTIKRSESRMKEKDKIHSSEWSVLNETQLASFRKLFSRFDQSQSGGISAEELCSAIEEMMPNETIPFEDVQKVHAELDIKHTGEIEFDEFLFAMTNPKNYLKLIQDDDRKQLTKEIKQWEEFQNEKSKIASKQRQALLSNGSNETDSNIFFTVVRTATRKDSMREIQNFYVNKIKRLNDHVIHDWSEGQRCIGLSDQDVLRRYNHIMKELNDKKSPFAKEKLYQESPYAKPLYWGLAELRLNSEIKRKSVRTDRIPRILKQATAMDRKRREQEDMSLRRTSSATSSTRSRVSPSLSDRITPTTEPARKVVEFQEDLTVPRRKSRTPARKQLFRAYSAPPTDIKSGQSIPKKDGKKRTSVRSAPPTRRIKISEFVVTPKVVPLPVYPIRNCPRSFDYDHVEEIRRQAAGILQEYYNKLKRVSATNSKVIYKKLQVDQISPVLQRHFKKSYLAYSGEYEPFVVSPWIPYPSPSPWVPCAPLGESRAKSAG